jgi:hypothetical protein
MSKRNGKGPRVYAAYKFTEKDPAIYELQRFLGNTKLSQVTKDGGPSTTCMHNWFHGETRRPQNATIEAAGRAMGFERKWMPMRKHSESKK